MVTTPPILTLRFKRVIVATEVFAGSALIWVCISTPGVQAQNAIMGPTLWFLGWLIYCLMPPFSNRQERP